MKTTLALIALACAALLAGCGGDANVRVQDTTTVSKGQELQDLQAARDMHAIDDSEYDSLRAKIMRRPN